LAPAEVQVAQAKGGKKAAASQSVGAGFVVSAAAQAASKDAPVPSAAVSDNSTSATVKVPENRMGIVVGPKGATIMMIKEKTGVKGIDMQGEVCTIVGPADAVTLAEAAVRQLVEKGYCALAYDDFEEEGVPCLPTLFPDIIGSKGAIIQLIKKEAKVEVSIPAVPKNPLPGKKYKVTLAGTKQAVALGKEIIKSIALYGHHEITHPGQVHKEMEVEEWRYRFLIGSKGSEMRHIQNNYKVKVNIPREHSECQNVVVVGEPRDVERAVAYIEKIMYEADQPRGRGAADKAEDTWGDEGEEEDWMKAYMYKR
jgi:rRNA processing protein Krr1/Pno1